MKKLPKHKQFAFTVKHNGIVNSLITDVVIVSPKQIPNILFRDTRVKAIWDTGATHTAISQTLANTLNLIPISKRKTNTANGIKDSNVYLVDIILPQGVGIASVGVGEVILPDGIDILIGMDIILRGDFSITNCENQTCFSFRIPSSKEIDYVKEIDRENEKIFTKVNKSQAKKKRKQERKDRKKQKRKK